MTQDKKQSKTTVVKEDEFTIKSLEAECSLLFNVARHTFRAVAVINNFKDTSLITKTKMKQLILKYQNTKVK